MRAWFAVALSVCAVAGWAQGGTGLPGSYFANTALQGAPVLTRTDPTVDFVWSGSPGGSVTADGFSVRWSGLVRPTQSGLYEFATESDDGVRLWVNGTLLVDHWTNHGPTLDSGSIFLKAGRLVPIRLEHYDAGGSATIRLLWKPPVGSRQVVPSSQLFAAGPGSAPEPPDDVRALVGDRTVWLEWDPSPRAASYLVYRSSSRSGPWETLRSTIWPRTIDTYRANGVPVFYAVAGLNREGQSDLSPAVRTIPGFGQPYHLGISVQSVDYVGRAYVNIVKIDGRRSTPTGGVVGTDALGNPTADFNLFVQDGGWIQANTLMSGTNGTYRLSFRGQADLPAGHWGGSIQNKVYNESTNLTTADWVVTELQPTMQIQFRNTRRTSASPLGSGVTEIQLRRPRTIGGQDLYPAAQVFTDEFLAAHRRGTVLRMMDFTATNFNIVERWADRRKVEELTYGDGQELGYGWQGRGSPWEHAILLCNETDRDLWVNVPLKADDDYVRQLARLIKTQLEADRKVYVELSNEVWNFGFLQHQQVRDKVDAELAANPASELNFDGAGVDGQGNKDYMLLVPRWWARRIMQVSDLFRAEFGEAAMMSRVRPLFETQAAWQHWIWAGLTFLDAYYNNGTGNHVPSPRPPHAYLWGAGGSSYNHGFPAEVLSDPNLTIDKVFQGYAQSWAVQRATMAQDTAWCAAFGLKRVAYEGGPGLDDFAGINSPKTASQRDPRMFWVYQRQIDEYYRAGGELHTTFLGVNAVHGLLPGDAFVGSQPRPKQEAFDALMRRTYRPEPTVGWDAPGSFAGRGFQANSNLYAAGTPTGSEWFGGSYDWRGYLVYALHSGTYQIALNTSGSNSGSAKVFVDGVPAGTVSCPNGGWSSSLSVSLTRGLHGLRVQRSAGSFTLNSVRLTR